MITSNARSTRRLLAAVFALAFAVSACGDSETGTTATTLPSTTETTSATTTTASPTSTTTSTTEAVSEPVPDAELPGDAFDFGPAEGSTVLVVGVAADDVLNVRRLPDASSEIITELDPTGETVLTSRKRDLSDSIWYEVETPDGTGWANARFLAPAGGTRDATNEFIDLLGALPTGTSTEQVIETFQQLLLDNGEQQEGPPMTATIVDGPNTGDLDDVTIDLLGYADDSVRGDRLHVFIMNEAGTASIKTIEATSLCQRGSDGAYCL